MTRTSSVTLRRRFTPEDARAQRTGRCRDHALQGSVLMKTARVVIVGAGLSGLYADWSPQFRVPSQVLLKPPLGVRNQPRIRAIPAFI